MGKGASFSYGFSSKIWEKEQVFHKWVFKQNMGFQKNTKASIRKEDNLFKVLARFTLLKCLVVGAQKTLSPSLLLLYAFQILSPNPSILSQCFNSLVV
jgi:hypothetical protein